MTGLKTPGSKFIKMLAAQGFDFGGIGIVFLFDSAHHQTLYGHQYSNMRSFLLSSLSILLCQKLSKITFRDPWFSFSFLTAPIIRLYVVTGHLT